MAWNWLSRSNGAPETSNSSSSSSSSSSASPSSPSSSAGPSGSKSSSASVHSGATTSGETQPPTLSKYQKILKDEMEYQEMQYESIEDLPGCMRLFDEFLMCNALMPHMRSFYRYGAPADCSRHWQDFKYCMSLKGEEEEDKRRLWIRRRAEWWASRRVGGSSEDVWDLRDTPLQNPFGGGQNTASNPSGTDSVMS